MESVKQSKFSKSTLLKRALCYMLTTAMAISGINMMPGNRIVANAETVIPTEPGSVLTDGNVYYVTSDTEITATEAGQNGLNVEEGKTAVIYIAKDVALTVKGANGNGQTGGGAGIYVPATSTLIRYLRKAVLRRPKRN